MYIRTALDRGSRTVRVVPQLNTCILSTWDPSESGEEKSPSRVVDPGALYDARIERIDYSDSLLVQKIGGAHVDHHGRKPRQSAQWAKAVTEPAATSRDRRHSLQ